MMQLLQCKLCQQNNGKNQARVRIRSQPKRNAKPPTFGDEIYCKERESRENKKAERKAAAAAQKDLVQANVAIVTD
jgi:hypothetical protein